MNLTPRKQDILFGSVKSYIESGQPVSSKELAMEALDGKNLSSATIRNELSALEEMGYLTKPHTSGGRLPTDKGLSLFIEHLVKTMPKKPKEIDEAVNKFTKSASYVSAVLRETANALSQKTNYPVVISIDGVEHIVIRNIKLSLLLGGQAIVLIETNCGLIDPIFIDLENGMNEESLRDVSNSLTNAFRDKTIKELIETVSEMAKEMNETLINYVLIYKKVAVMLKEYLENLKRETYKAGTTKLLGTVDEKTEKEAIKLVEYIETADVFKDDIAKDAIEIRAGPETNPLDIRVKEDGTVIKTGLEIAGVRVANLAVVAPKRVDYVKVASVLLAMTRN